MSGVNTRRSPSTRRGGYASLAPAHRLLAQPLSRPRSGARAPAIGDHNHNGIVAIDRSRLLDPRWGRCATVALELLSASPPPRQGRRTAF